ncbi:MAG: GTPase [Planctomycetota bacterium]|nr:GTPase [Planctomycetota bacterium]
MDSAKSPTSGPSECDASHCQAAMLTPLGRGAIASIVVEGPGSIEVVEHFFRGQAKVPLAQAPCNRILFGRWQTASTSEELVICRSDINRIEIHCHGGHAAPQSVLSSLQTLGCRVLPWKQLLGTSDTIAAEAMAALTECETERTAAILLKQHGGVLVQELRRILQQLQSGERNRGLARLHALIATWDFGRHLTRPWQIVVTGAPNVGKSSLVNALVGFRRSIVTNQAGTTRDLVAADTAINGWPIRLVDTAGLRPTSNLVEKQGISLARQQIRTADLVLEIRDLTVASEPQPQNLVDHHDTPLITVWNKIDLVDVEATAISGLLTSARTGLGIQNLIDHISQKLVVNPPALSTPVLFTSRQYHLVQEVVACLLDAQVPLAVQNLTRLCR